MPGHVLEHRSSEADAGRFVCSHHPSCALSGDKGYVYFRLPPGLPGAFMFVMRDIVLLDHCFFVPMLLLNFVYIQSHTSTVIDLCMDNLIGAVPY